MKNSNSDSSNSKLGMNNNLISADHMFSIIPSNFRAKNYIGIKNAKIRISSPQCAIEPIRAKIPKGIKSRRVTTKPMESTSGTTLTGNTPLL